MGESSFKLPLPRDCWKKWSFSSNRSVQFFCPDLSWLAGGWWFNRRIAWGVKDAVILAKIRWEHWIQTFVNVKITNFWTHRTHDYPSYSWLSIVPMTIHRTHGDPSYSWWPIVLMKNPWLSWRQVFEDPILTFISWPYPKIQKKEQYDHLFRMGDSRLEFWQKRQTECRNCYEIVDQQFMCTFKQRNHSICQFANIPYLYERCESRAHLTCQQNKSWPEDIQVGGCQKVFSRGSDMEF